MTLALITNTAGCPVCHLIERLLVGRRGFLQPIEVLQATLGVLDRRGKVGRKRQSWASPLTGSLLPPAECRQKKVQKRLVREWILA